MRYIVVAACLFALSMPAIAKELGLSIGDNISPYPRDTRTVAGKCVADHLPDRCSYTVRIMRRDRTHWLLLVESIPSDENGTFDNILLDVVEMPLARRESIATHQCQIGRNLDESIHAFSKEQFYIDYLSAAVDWAVRVDFDELKFVPIDASVVRCKIKFYIE